MNILSRSAISLYWGMLTPEARILSVVQIALLIGRLLLPVLAAHLGWGWFTATHSNDLRISALGVEAILLIVYLIQWCAWSELIYSLRLRFRPSQTSKSSTKRRFALHLYSGFIFLIVLSGLVTVQPLLGIGAMFLLFMSAEAQASSLAQRPLPVALLWGMRRSYKLISREPWQFLGLLVLPGVVLYGYGALLVSVGISGGWGLAATLLMLIPWCACFLLAQLRVALRGVPRDQASSSFHQRLGTFNQQCDRLAWGLMLVSGGWLLLQLGVAGLLSFNALALAFGQVVTYLFNIVGAFLSMLVKAGFIAIVVGFVAAALMLMIRLGQGKGLKDLQSVANNLQKAIQKFSDKLAKSQLDLFKGASLGLGTLLTLLGTVAVDTYARVQKDQEKQKIAQEERQRVQTKQEEEIKARTTQNDELVARVRTKIEELRKETDAAKQVPLRDQLLTELRDVLPRLRLVNGDVDGDRKGRILRYLYESDLLAAEGCQNEQIDKVIDETLRGEPAKKAYGKILQGVNPGLKEAKQELSELLEKGAISDDDKGKKEVQENKVKSLLKCHPLYLHEMDFSGASLQDAFLNNAFLPLVNLSNSNLRGAKLKRAWLNLANLEDADLEGADLTKTALSGSILVGANLSNTLIDDKDKDTDDKDEEIGYKHPKINGIIAFYTAHTLRKKENKELVKGSISWDLFKGNKPGELPSLQWNFCPLDPQAEREQGEDTQTPLTSQGGSKCRNRRFDPRGKPSGQVGNSAASSEYNQRDWSGSSFKQSNMKGMIFENIKLDGADLSGATLEDMKLKNVSFAGANLENTVIRESELDDVDFTGARMKGFRLERMRKLVNINYLGSLIDLNENPTYSLYQKNRLRQKVYDPESFGNRNPEEIATFRRNSLAPLILTALPLRPQQLLYWMLAYPLPGPSVPKGAQQ